LLTGITGFVGRHLGIEILKRGYEVFGLARYVSDRDVSDLSGITIYYGDILDSFFLRKVFKKVQPDVIVHLATQSSVEYSFNNPLEEYNVGFIGTTNVAYAAIEEVPKLRKFIYASSVEVYGNQDNFPIKEDATLRPASPYGVAKVASEYFFKYLFNGYGFPCIILRSTNTYGRNYNHNFVVEHIIYEMLSGKGEVLMGDPAPIRDFLYIDDEVDAYIKVIETEKDIFGEIMNTGTGRGVSVRELVEIIGKMVDFKGEVKWCQRSLRPFEIKKLIVDTEKIRRLLGWSPRYTLEEGLKRTIEWWRNYLDRDCKRR
jgi:dTDP-glucose 4,6-dehydratase